MAKIELRKIDEAEYPEFIDAVYSSYSKNMSIASYIPLREATKYGEELRKEDLPQGYRTPGYLFYYIYSGEEKVGALCLTLPSNTPSKYVYVYDLVIYEPYRRQGYATAALLEAERIGRETDCTRIDLNVFARNTGAQALYKKLGYSFTTMRMNKEL